MSVVKHIRPDHDHPLCNVIARHGLSVSEVEDVSKQKWAIKGIDSGPNAAREAERLCKLHRHPLIVPLQSTFLDADRLYLQMPFYKDGSLRHWAESIKVCLAEHALSVICCRLWLVGIVDRVACLYGICNDHGLEQVA